MPSAIGPFCLVPQAEGRPQGEIWDLRAAPDGTLWLVTEKGVGSLHGGIWTLHFSERSGILAGFDDAGRTWLILDEGEAIAAWDGVSWTTYGPEAGWSPVYLYWWVPNLVTDRRGWVWLGLYDDVRVFDGRIWTVYTPEEIDFALPPDDSDSIRFTGAALDSSGNVWVGGCYYRDGGPGARWFNGEEWQGADSHMVGSGCVTAIEADAAGNIWVGMGTDLWRYIPGEGWTRFTLPPEELRYPLRAITAITPRPGGETLWIGSHVYDRCGGGSDCCAAALFLFRVTDGTFRKVEDYYTCPPGNLAVDAAGTAFFCGGGFIYRAIGETAELLAELPAGNPWPWCHIEVDPVGRVWAAAGDWLWVYEPAGGE